MKLKEWVDVLSENNKGIPEKELYAAVLMSIQRIIRTILHRKPRTIEQLYLPCKIWMNTYGFPTRESIAKWMEDQSDLFEIDIPDSIVKLAISLELKDNIEKDNG